MNTTAPVINGMPRKLRNTNAAASATYPPSENRVAGKPLRVTRPVFSTALPVEIVGEWTAEVGAWAFQRSADTAEIFHILSGRCRVATTDGHGITFGPGEIGLLPPSFRGVFTVIETVTKLALTVPAGAHELDRLEALE